MNSLYADAAGHVLDPLGGMDDLRARRLRFVGDPAQRIAEDYLRILRFFRFHAQYGDPDHGLDPDGLAACADGAEGLARLSAERVTGELRKLLSAHDPSPSVAAMHHASVLVRVLPGADPRGLAPLVHLDAGVPPRWLRRLAVLGGETSALRLTKAEARDLTCLRGALGDMTAPALLGYRLGAELGTDAVLARAATFKSPCPPIGRSEIAAAAHPRASRSAHANLPGLDGAGLGTKTEGLGKRRWITSGFPRHARRSAGLTGAGATNALCPVPKDRPCCKRQTPPKKPTLAFRLAGLIDGFAHADGPPPQSLLRFMLWSVKGSWPVLALATVISAIVGTTEVISALLLGQIIDAAVGTGAQGFIAAHGWLITGFVVFFHGGAPAGLWHILGGQ